jgi:hypothetical protein
MGKTSYEKIYEALLSTQDCQDFVDNIRREIIDTHIFDIEISMIRPETLGDRARLETYYNVKMPLGRQGATRDGKIWMSISINKSHVRYIIERHFGVDVSTYNCRKDVVIGERYRKGTECFYEWLQQRIQQDFADIIDEAKSRIENQYYDWRDSELVARRQREFFSECAAKDIKKALAMYEHLGTEVLKDAVNEFLVHSVFEFDETGD